MNAANVFCKVKLVRPSRSVYVQIGMQLSSVQVLSPRLGRGCPEGD
jgi:hypothetical protein